MHFVEVVWILSDLLNMVQLCWDLLKFWLHIVDLCWTASNYFLLCRTMVRLVEHSRNRIYLARVGKAPRNDKRSLFRVPVPPRPPWGVRKSDVTIKGRSPISHQTFRSSVGARRIQVSDFWKTEAVGKQWFMSKSYFNNPTSGGVRNVIFRRAEFLAVELVSNRFFL